MSIFDTNCIHLLTTRFQECLYMIDFIEQRLSKGRYTFAIDDLKAAFPNRSEAAIKLALSRMVAKKKAVRVHQRFYVIVSSEFRSKGILPPVYVIPDLMKFLNRRYYVSLLSAAALHGAAHQQPQKFFVSIEAPPLRAKRLPGLSLDFVVTRAIPETLVIEMKTPAGFVKVSNPLLTLSDLLEFPHRAGGWERVLEVAEELTESIAPDMITKPFRAHVKQVTLQRLGFFWEYVRPAPVLADKLWKMAGNHKLFALNWPIETTSANAAGNRWRVRIPE